MLQFTHSLSLTSRQKAWLMSTALFLLTPTSFVFAQEIPDPIYGVTTDSPWNYQEHVEALKNLSRVATTRIVFDEYVPATEYRDEIKAIHNVSYVMGEVLDSFYVKDYSIRAYSTRVREYIKELGDFVDIWEIGNEVNGEWLGSTSDVIHKISDAYRQVRAANGKAALTLYYNKDCWASPRNEMFRWTKKNVPSEIKQGIDYIFVSYYEEDCNGLQPDWQMIFDRLGDIFPNAKMGIGEAGTRNKNKKEEYIRRYYNLEINHPRYVGGVFWWYFRQDMVPMSKPLWSVFNDVIQR